MSAEAAGSHFAVVSVAVIADSAAASEQRQPRGAAGLVVHDAALTDLRPQVGAGHGVGAGRTGPYLHPTAAEPDCK